jgi:membrane protein
MKVGDRPGVRRVRRAAERGKKKYAGSWAEDLWRRLDSMDFINRGMLFAATLLLCLFPFLIVLSALAGRPVVNTLARYTGLNSQAAADAGHLFASTAATANAVAGTTSMVFFVVGGIAAAAALQEIYEQVFELPHRGMTDVPRRLAWLAVLIGTSLLTGRTGPWLHHAGGAALLAAAGLVWSTGFWWLTMRILLAGRISWQKLFPAACATGVLYVAMEAVFSLFFSGMVISDENRYGPIGIIFALLSYLIAIGVVVILGAVAGLAWYERSSGKSETGHLPRPSGNSGGPGDGRHECAVPRPRPESLYRAEPGTHSQGIIGPARKDGEDQATLPRPAGRP